MNLPQPNASAHNYILINNGKIKPNPCFLYITPIRHGHIKCRKSTADKRHRLLTACKLPAAFMRQCVITKMSGFSAEIEKAEAENR